MDRASSPLLQAHTTCPQPPHQPKGRGRPRASYAQTGEFDLGLIREFRSRPALYDRSNKRFKDKIYVAQLWLQISHKLGYDVSILRDRMITLRNRYNIEKRRVENNSVPNSTSHWPLYDNLSFLSEHIRSRISYKAQYKSVDSVQGDDDEEETFHVDDAHSESNGPAKHVKHEMDFEDVDEFDCDGQMPVTTMLSIPHSTPLSVSNGSSNHNNDSNTNNINCKAHLKLNNTRQSEKLLRVARPKRIATTNEEDSKVSKRRLDGDISLTKSAAMDGSITYPKFRAFGEFVSHSLNELPHSISMQLIESFTRELVQATISNNPSQQQKRESEEPSSMDDMDD